jgi:hypothetical protein
VWTVIFAGEFEREFEALPLSVQDELVAQMKLIEMFGPQARRPRVDRLNESKHANMKELRFAAADGEWRAAFAFDPERKAVVLCAGDKSGVAQPRFYKVLIAKADKRFDAHLTQLKKVRR